MSFLDSEDLREVLSLTQETPRQLQNEMCLIKFQNK